MLLPLLVQIEQKHSYLALLQLWQLLCASLKETIEKNGMIINSIFVIKNI